MKFYTLFPSQYDTSIINFKVFSSNRDHVFNYKEVIRLTSIGVAFLIISSLLKMNLFAIATVLTKNITCMYINTKSNNKSSYFNNKLGYIEQLKYLVQSPLFENT